MLLGLSLRQERFKLTRWPGLKTPLSASLAAVSMRAGKGDAMIAGRGTP